MSEIAPQDANPSIGSDADSRNGRYYEQLAEHYHRSVADWHGAVRRHGRALDELLRHHGAPGRRVLDVACGIGTQSLGLALRGYQVTGLDASAAAVARATREAAAFGVAASFHVGDMRTPNGHAGAGFDAVICCDNSLPHLLTDADLARALDAMLTCIRPGGIVLASIRDYDRHAATRPVVTMPELTGDGMVFQRWQWLDERTYRARLFILGSVDDGQEWTVDTFDGATFRAWQRAEIAAVVTALGAEATWLSPAAAGYHQHTLIIEACAR